jgi:hypothetical protein
MPNDTGLNDTELRELFRRAAGPSSSIDPAMIIRRSKRRRLPRQLSTGGALTLAVAGIGVASVTGIGGMSIFGARTASDLSERAADAPGTDATAASPYATEDGAGCEAAPPVSGTNPWRLTLEVAPTDGRAVSANETAIASFTLRNDGSTPVSVSPVGPVVHTLQRDGAIVATGSGELLASGGGAITSVDLGPAESVQLQSRFALQSCLPADTRLQPGNYTLTTHLSVQSDGATATVNGTQTRITLR